MAGFGGGSEGTDGSGNAVGGSGAGMGGAIFNMFGTVNLVNCTIYGNHAYGGSSGGSAATDGYGLGAGIFNVDGIVIIQNVTIANNDVAGQTAGGGALYSIAFGNQLADGTGQRASVYAANCIIAGSSSAGSDVRIKAVSGNQTNITFFNGSGPNIFRTPMSTDTAPGGIPVTVTDPMLGTFGDHGGPTSTISLQAGSPAIGAANPSSALATDQRGVPRGLHPDIGAFQTHDSRFVTGADAGGGSELKVFDASGTKIADFFAFDPSFTAGVRVAVADVNGDGVADIIAGAGPSGGPELKVIDGTKLTQLLPNNKIAPSALLADFFAFDPSFQNGVFVAAADFNGDGKADVVVGAGAGGGPEVKVIDATKLGQLQGNNVIAPAALLGDFFAFQSTVTAGINVAVGDINLDGLPDLIMGAGPGQGPEVKAVSGSKLNQVATNPPPPNLSAGEILPSALVADFFAFAPTFTGGAFVAAGDINNDGSPDIVVGAAATGGPEVKVVSGSQVHQLQGNNEIANSALLGDFFAYDPSFTGGARVAVTDFGNTGHLDIVTGGGPGLLPSTGQPPMLQVINGAQPIPVVNNEVAPSALLDQFAAFGGFAGGFYVGGD